MTPIDYENLQFLLHLILEHDEEQIEEWYQHHVEISPEYTSWLFALAAEIVELILVDKKLERDKDLTQAKYELKRIMEM